MNNFKPVIILEPGGDKAYRYLQEKREGLEAFQTSWSRGRRIGWEEKKEDDDTEEEINGKRRDEEDRQDSLVMGEGMIVKFPLVRVATFAAPASRFSPARRS